jgi:hypothetical protein
MKQSQSQALTGAYEGKGELHGNDVDIRELHGTPREVGELPGESSKQIKQALPSGRSPEIEGNSTESTYPQNEG